MASMFDVLRERAIKKNGLSGAQQPQTPDIWDDPRFTSMTTDPFKELAGSPYAQRFLNPEGDPELFRALKERGARAAGGRRRAATGAIRARGGSSPAGYAYAQMLANLQGESDLAGTMSEATAASIGENRRFAEGLLDRKLGGAEELQRERRSSFQRATDRMWEYKYWLEQQREMNKIRKSQKKGLFGTGIGSIGAKGFGISSA